MHSITFAFFNLDTYVYTMVVATKGNVQLLLAPEKVNVCILVFHMRSIVGFLHNHPKFKATYLFIDCFFWEERCTLVYYLKIVHRKRQKETFHLTS